MQTTRSGRLTRVRAPSRVLPSPRSWAGIGLVPTDRGAPSLRSRQRPPGAPVRPRTQAPVREPTTSEDSEGELTASSDSGGSAAAHSDTSSPDEAAAASPTPPVAEAHGGGTRRAAPAKRSQSTLDRFFGNGRGAGAAASKQDGREGLQCSMARCPEPNGRPDDMLVCSRAACGQAAHPECLNFGEELARVVRSRDDWLCTDCKRCSVCLANTHDRLLVYCDDCDRAVHTFCAEPKLKAVPRGAVRPPAPQRQRRFDALQRLAVPPSSPP